MKKDFKSKEVLDTKENRRFINQFIEKASKK